MWYRNARVKLHNIAIPFVMVTRCENNFENMVQQFEN